MANGNGQEKKGSQLALIRRAAGLTTEKWNDERINAVVAMFAGNAKTPGQAAVFLAVANKYELAPEMGEIWLGEIRGRPTVLVGRDAYIKVAQRDPGYRGFEADVVREKDEYWVERNGSEIVVHHTKKGFNRGKILGAYALVPHADRAPVFVEKHMDELGHLVNKDVWKQNPAEMVLTRALTFALKLQFNISGVYSPADELTDEDLDDIAGRNLAGNTAQQMDQLKERMKGVQARVAEEKAEAVEGEDYDIEPREAEQEDVPEPTGQDVTDKSDYERAKGRYFALCTEKGLEGDARKEWQRTHIEKESAAHFSTEDFRKAIEMLEAGIGLEPAGVPTEGEESNPFEEERRFQDELPMP